MSPEERLLKNIFASDESCDHSDSVDDDTPDNYPDTYLEKSHYAESAIQHSLVYVSEALKRLSRLHSLLLIGQENGVNKLPNVITNNESRMALKHLRKLKCCVCDAIYETNEIYESTKGVAK